MKRFSRPGRRKLARGGDWETTFWPLSTTVLATVLGKARVPYKLLAMVPAAGGLGTVGVVQIAVHETVMDFLAVTATGLYTVGFGIYKAKYDAGLADFAPVAADPLLPADAARDKFWLKMELASIWIPASTAVTLPVEIRMVDKRALEIAEGEALIGVISLQSQANAGIWGATVTLRNRFKQRRLE